MVNEAVPGTTFFVGIVPPPVLLRRLQSMQRVYGNNRTEPHITLLPPAALTTIDPYLPVLRQLACETPVFDVQLPCTGWFGKGVLYLQAESAALMRLQQQVQQLTCWPLAMGKKNAHPYHPHLTLGRRWCGFSTADLFALENDVNHLLQTGPITFTVLLLRVYGKRPGSGYVTVCNLPLKNSPPAAGC